MFYQCLSHRHNLVGCLTALQIPANTAGLFFHIHKQRFRSAQIIMHTLAADVQLCSDLFQLLAEGGDDSLFDEESDSFNYDDFDDEDDDMESDDDVDASDDEEEDDSEM